MFHCSQGEHRSATILVLYIASRSHCSFEASHAFVSSIRDIKPYMDDHVTLMTTAYGRWEELLKQLATGNR